MIEHVASCDSSDAIGAGGFGLCMAGVILSFIGVGAMDCDVNKAISYSILATGALVGITPIVKLFIWFVTA